MQRPLVALSTSDSDTVIFDILYGTARAAVVLADDTPSSLASDMSADDIPTTRSPVTYPRYPHMGVRFEQTQGRVILLSSA